MTRKFDDDGVPRAKGIRGSLFGSDGPREPYKSKYPDGLPGHANTSASTAAARSWLTGATNLQKRVYAELKRRGRLGATIAEIAMAIEEYDYSVAPRLTELQGNNLIVDSEAKRKVRVTCPNCSHCLRTTKAQTVYVVRYLS